MKAWLRFPLPLRLTIPVLVLAFNVCFVAATAFTVIRRDRAREVQRISSYSAQQALRLASAAAEHLAEGSPGPQREFFKHELAFLGTDPSIRWALVTSPDHSILYSSKEELRGGTLKDLLDDERQLTVTRALEQQSVQQSLKEGEFVVTAHPVPAAPNVPRLMVVMQHDLTRPMSSLRVNAEDDLLVAFLLMLIACLGLWLALKGYLNSRARAVVENARKSTSSHPPTQTGGDEFSEISRALRESEDRFRQVGSQIHDVFYMISADRRSILYVNPAYEEIWGRSVQSLMKSPEDLLQSVEEAERDEVMRQHEPLFHGSAGVRMEYRIRRPDGLIRWIENRAFPVLDESGKVYCIAGLARDVTDRKMLERELLNASENERRRIGRDLHDDLCQRLAAIKIRCELLAEAIRKGEPADAAKATELSSLISEAAALCRGVARTLVPVDLAGEGLMVALDRLVKTVEALHEVPCFFHCPHSVMVESTSASVHLYRITQEFLSNAMRHGKPTRVDVRLEQIADSIRVEVVNDGQPFPEPDPLNHGMGLKILHFRADAIGAILRIEPRSDGIPGTQAICIAPHASCNPDPPSKA